MNQASFRVELLRSEVDRSGFSCGSEALDKYFRQLVTQDIRRRVTSCFVALSKQNEIAGYYTLACASVLLADLPPETAKKLPRYPSVPAVRMGRLAIDTRFKRQGLGGALLADALTKASRSGIAAFALLVDAKDEEAVTFYVHHGFLALPMQRKTLFLPLATVAKTPSREVAANTSE